jgi:hypothetical protein
MSLTGLAVEIDPNREIELRMSWRHALVVEVLLERFLEGGMADREMEIDLQGLLLGLKAETARQAPVELL